jgi:predicted alpha/beta hydrolase
VVETDIEIPCADGRTLAASLFGERRGASLVIVIAGATGVCRRLYRRFAAFLATRGSTVVTFDYRGVGDSRREPLRRDPACLSDWGRLDLSAVLRWASDEIHSAAPCVVAHSVGGQLLPLVEHPERIPAVLYVAAQEGYWGNWPLPLGLVFVALCHVIMPGLARTAGFLPTRALRLGEDLPPGVGLEWARWARTRDYLQRAPFFDRLACPALAYGFADDALAPPRAVDRLLTSQPRLTVQRRQVSPADLALARIGHFGFFRHDLGSSLWTESSDWLHAIVRGGRVAEVAS